METHLHRVYGCVYVRACVRARACVCMICMQFHPLLWAMWFSVGFNTWEASDNPGSAKEERRNVRPHVIVVVWRYLLTQYGLGPMQKLTRDVHSIFEIAHRLKSCLFVGVVSDVIPTHYQMHEANKLLSKHHSNYKCCTWRIHISAIT